MILKHLRLISQIAMSSLPVHRPRLQNVTLKRMDVTNCDFQTQPVTKCDPRAKISLFSRQIIDFSCICQNFCVPLHTKTRAERKQHDIMKGKGYVYILTNPAFRENWVKIGKSSRPVDVQSCNPCNPSSSIWSV